MMKFLIYSTLLLSLFSCAYPEEPVATVESIGQSNIVSKGPEKGKLLLLGGGITEQHVTLFKRFSGDSSSTIIVIPTAFSDEEIAADPQFDKVKRRFEKLGIPNITILHTRDKDQANDASFYEPIEAAKGVFILGGKTERITASYANTATEDALRELLNRNGIIAGVSAGSGVQANYFSSQEKQQGFEFLQGVILMNHFLAKNKLFDHSLQILDHAEYLSLGIDNNTGILVDGTTFEVVGQSYVAVYDGTMYHRYNDSISNLGPLSDQFYLLQNGDRYDLSARVVESNARRAVIPMTAQALSAYEGHFQAKNKPFNVDVFLENDTLRLQNSWVETLCHFTF